MNTTTNNNMFRQTKMMNDPFRASKKDILFLPLTKKNDLFYSMMKFNLLNASMRCVLSYRFPLEYKNESLFYTDCGCGLDPLMTTYDNCDDDFYSMNFDDIAHPRSVLDLCGTKLRFYDVQYLTFTTFVSVTSHNGFSRYI